MTAKNPGGAPVPGAWGQQQKKGMEKQDQHSQQNAQSNQQQGGPSTSGQQQSQGDARTPDKPIGQVAYADNNKQQGGAGEPQTTPLEPEKQGGIGGP